MNFSFNLIDEAWIPCLPVGGGATELVSLRRALLGARDFREIYSESPLVTVSLYRLLLAVIYRACVPLDIGAVSGWLRDGMPRDRIEAYLEKWHDRFDLFSESHPFFQTAGMAMKAEGGLERLAHERNFTTIFGDTIDPAEQNYQLNEIAQFLVAAQAYSLGFGKSGNVVLDGEEVTPPYSADALVLRGATVWITSDTLERSLLLNCVPYNLTDDEPEQDLPSWEQDRPHDLRDVSAGKERVTVPARGFADRYTWQSRLIRLLPEEHDGEARVRAMFFAQGRSADKDSYDPMKAYVLDEKTGESTVNVSIGKAMWRNAQVLLPGKERNRKEPMVSRLPGMLIRAGAVKPEERYNLNSVGLATAPNKAGKFMLWRHDRMPVRARMFDDKALVEILDTCLNAAETVATQLSISVNGLCRHYLALGDRNPDPADVRKLADSLQAREDYWAALEPDFYTFLDMLPEAPEAAQEWWIAQVDRRQRSAYDAAVMRLGQSLRATVAAARARRIFDPFNEKKPKKSKRKEAAS